MDPSSINALRSARRTLHSSLEKSRAISVSVSRSSPAISDLLQRRLPAIESSARSICASLSAVSTVGPHIDRAVGPAAAVLKVFDAVHGLESALLHPVSDLHDYLSVVVRLEEALRFLSETTPLAIQWLRDIVEFLSDNSIADPLFLSRLSDAVSHLKSADSDPSLDGGLLAAALDILEAEFRQLLSEYSSPASQDAVLPVSVVNKLSAILERMAANDQLERCAAAYAEVRSSAARGNLQPLGLAYLAGSGDTAQALRAGVDQWGNHLEFAVKHVLDREYRLCEAVFDKFRAAGANCFSEVASRTGVLEFLQFGQTVCRAKKDPAKLLQLLDVFISMSRLRPDFNRLFGQMACAGIQSQTRELVKCIVDGAAEIFGEMLSQVALMKRTRPPADGTAPRFVTVVVDYCNKLLSPPYYSAMTQVLKIRRTWKKERGVREKVLVDAILDIVKTLEGNLEPWSKFYDDETLSYFFSMNAHLQLLKSAKRTALGQSMGDVWLDKHDRSKEYYATMFVEGSWGKLRTLLRRERLTQFSSRRTTARDMAKKQLRAFADEFDNMYRRQSGWVVPDKEMGEQARQMVSDVVVKEYRNYIRNCGLSAEQHDGSAGKYGKFYTAPELEKMVGSLFQRKESKHSGSGKT